MTQYAISQHQEGICLNPREYALESGHPDAEIKLFDSACEARTWLRERWVDMPENPEDLDEYGVFIEPYEEDSYD